MFTQGAKPSSGEPIIAESLPEAVDVRAYIEGLKRKVKEASKKVSDWKKRLLKVQEALRKESLEEVNKVLGAMSVEEAEGVVESLQMAGILNFMEGGVRDATGEGGVDAVLGKDKE